MTDISTITLPNGTAYDPKDNWAREQIGSGLLNTTNKTIIPAINELNNSLNEVWTNLFPDYPREQQLFGVVTETTDEVSFSGIIPANGYVTVRSWTQSNNIESLFWRLIVQGKTVTEYSKLPYSSNNTTTHLQVYSYRWSGFIPVRKNNNFTIHVGGAAIGIGYALLFYPLA